MSSVYMDLRGQQRRGRDGTVYQTPYVSARANTIPQGIQSLSPAHHATYTGAIRKRGKARQAGIVVEQQRLRVGMVIERSPIGSCVLCPSCRACSRHKGVVLDAQALANTSHAALAGAVGGKAGCGDGGDTSDRSPSRHLCRACSRREGVILDAQGLAGDASSDGRSPSIPCLT